MNWIDHKTWKYKVENGKLYLGTGKAEWKLDYSQVKELFKRIPNKCTVKELMTTAKKMNLKVSYTAALLLMRVFSNYVEFDGELERRERKLFLVKDRHSIFESFKRQYAVEKELCI